jgi:hypothetical protein
MGSFSPAAEARRAFQATAVVSVGPAAVRANRLAIGVGPTDSPKGHFRLIVLHREDGGQRKGLGGAGEEEMLGHLLTSRL